MADQLFAAQSRIKIAMVAGEASGDLLGSHLIRALKARFPDAEFVGIGGPKMQGVGLKSVFPMETLAVNGYVEVLKNLRAILRIRRDLTDQLLADRPHVFIGIDAPDFNLGLERTLKAKGVTTIHYVSPSIWAWRGERIKKIKACVSHMLALFPMEPPLYQQAGIPVTYVGHPLADEMPLVPDLAAMREQLDIPLACRVIALLPGSRQSEVAALAETYINTAKLLSEQVPNVLFLVPLVSRETRALFEATLYRLQAQALPLRIMFGHAHDALIAADVALVASGTATLETALLKRPMVITYKVSPLTYRLMWHRKYLPYIGLPNVLAGDFVVPEILQDDATPANLAQALTNMLDHNRVVDGLQAKFMDIHLTLRQGTAERAAEAIAAYLPHAH
ncbi:lipid-A-disaccharide synthase [Chitinivorax tropicus]|uniref:Lipid-A-disaccharide synthase n=1 Tax=Chitinivorax tropicus TaxID=714531 RepID=A0A840MQ33_9PROT|nr:lipid-A-disaccharide synthase [Chitinivorax tropicus]MBB5019555.1 lipid-A-disaccharide synthase [Chitinivorax tropicus]